MIMFPKTIKSTVLFKHRKTDKMENRIEHIELQHSVLPEIRYLGSTEEMIAILYLFHKK